MKSELLVILNKFKDKKILVIGDIMLDKYIWGDVTRISPEAPVQVVHVLKETYSPGGASNVAVNISSLSGNSMIMGIVGDDDSKNVLIKELKKMKVNTEGIFVDNDKPTTQKIRIIGKSQQLLRVDYESKEHAHKYIEKKLIDFLEKNVKNVEVVVISDYAKGVITPKIAEDIVKISKKYNKPIIVDPKPKHLGLYSNVTLITPNNAEASEMAGMEDCNDENVLKIGRKLMKQLDANVLITRGDRGMSLFEKQEEDVHIPAKAKEVYSLIGAGDTVVATIALALASGANLKEASFLANIAAGIKVGKIGTASVTIDEIRAEIEKL